MATSSLQRFERFERFERFDRNGIEILTIFYHAGAGFVAAFDRKSIKSKTSTSFRAISKGELRFAASNG